MAETGKQQKTLIAFKSGHYKKVVGTWTGKAAEKISEGKEKNDCVDTVKK